MFSSAGDDPFSGLLECLDPENCPAGGCLSGLEREHSVVASLEELWEEPQSMVPDCCKDSRQSQHSQPDPEKAQMWAMMQQMQARLESAERAITELTEDRNQLRLRLHHIEGMQGGPASHLQNCHALASIGCL